jgi:hypothetical protein
MTLTIAEARADLDAVLDRIVADREPVKIRRWKGEGVVLVPRRAWNSIEERCICSGRPPMRGVYWKLCVNWKPVAEKSANPPIQNKCTITGIPT